MSKILFLFLFCFVSTVSEAGREKRAGSFPVEHKRPRVDVDLSSKKSRKIRFWVWNVLTGDPHRVFRYDLGPMDDRHLDSVRSEDVDKHFKELFNLFLNSRDLIEPVIADYNEENDTDLEMKDLFRLLRSTRDLRLARLKPKRRSRI